MPLKSFESSSSRPVHVTKWAVYFCAALEKDKFVTAVCDAFSQKVQVGSVPYVHDTLDDCFKTHYFCQLDRNAEV